MDVEHKLEELKYANTIIGDIIKRRVLDSNKNFIGIVTGGTGSGKSYSAMRLGEMIDPDFSIRNVAFTAKEFMSIINSKWIKRGSCIILDEGQISVNRRDWFSIANKLLNLVLSTFRNMNLVVLFTTPNLEYIDSQALKLFHMHFETRGILKSRRRVVMKCFWLVYNNARKRLFTIQPRVKLNDHFVRVPQVYFKLPSLGLCRAYEKKKAAFNKKLNADVLEAIELTDAGNAIKLSQANKKLMQEKQRLEAQKNKIEVKQLLED